MRQPRVLHSSLLYVAPLLLDLRRDPAKGCVGQILL